MKAIDPLEETVGADDIIGRNNCPIWERISAVGCFSPDQRVSIMNGSRNSDHTKQGKYWILVGGIKERKTKLSEIAEIVGRKTDTMQKIHNGMVRKNETYTDTAGYRWGFGDTITI